MNMAAPRTVSRPELLADGTDDAFRKCVHGLLAFSARLETIRSGFGERIGLSGIQYTILITVAHLNDNNGISVKQIGRHLALSGAFITIETGKLEKKGLITKKQDPQDRRAVLVQVTKKGSALLDELAPVQVKVNDILFGSLGRQDFERLNKMLVGLVQGADAAAAMIAYLSASARIRQ
jgi:DNA-binding MarR family transcriptional regulator